MRIDRVRSIAKTSTKASSRKKITILPGTGSGITCKSYVRGNPSDGKEYETFQHICTVECWYKATLPTTRKNQTSFSGSSSI